MNETSTLPTDFKKVRSRHSKEETLINESEHLA